METYFGIKEGKCKVKVQVKLQNIKGEGPEFPRIIIPIGISGESSKERLVYTLMTIQGDMIIRGQGKYATIANFSENATLKIETEINEREVKLIVPIDFWRLEKIEQIRQDDLELAIECNLNYLIWNIDSKRSDFSSTDNQSIRIIIPQSEWIRILKKTGFTDLKILEIPYPEIIGHEKFDTMITHLNESKDFFYRGDYESAVEECRLSIEPIPSLLPIEKISRADGKDPTFKDKLDQFCKQHIKSEIGKEKTKMLTETIWSFSSIFHHPSSSKPSKIVNVNRADAEFIVHTVSGIISYLGKILSKKKKIVELT